MRTWVGRARGKFGCLPRVFFRSTERDVYVASSSPGKIKSKLAQPSVPPERLVLPEFSAPITRQQTPAAARHKHSNKAFAARYPNPPVPDKPPQSTTATPTTSDCYPEPHVS